jgi:hypothetical protein
MGPWDYQEAVAQFSRAPSPSLKHQQWFELICTSPNNAGNARPLQSEEQRSKATEVVQVSSHPASPAFAGL